MVTRAESRAVGILAVQGAFAAHAKVLAELGHRPRLIQRTGDLAGLDGLVLPGGESTAQLRLLAALGMWGPLRDLATSGRPVLATCAGLILLAREVTEPAQDSLRILDVSVARNGWGRQLDSFEALDDGGELPLVFIRAPRIRAVGAEVEVVARCGGEPVLVRQGAITAATFHPELAPAGASGERRWPVHEAVFGAAATPAVDAAGGHGRGSPPRGCLQTGPATFELENAARPA